MGLSISGMVVETRISPQRHRGHRERLIRWIRGGRGAWRGSAEEMHQGGEESNLRAYIPHDEQPSMAFQVGFGGEMGQGRFN